VLEVFYRLGYGVMKANQHFEGAYHLYLQGLKGHEARKTREVCTNLCLLFDNDDVGDMSLKMSDDSTDHDDIGVDFHQGTWCYMPEDRSL
jgi:hypothetical protein